MPAVAQLLDDAAHEHSAERIEARGRLVEEHELRRVHERLRETRALDHAFAIGMQTPVGRLGERDAREQRVDACLERRAAQTEQPAVDPQ